MAEVGGFRRLSGRELIGVRMMRVQSEFRWIVQRVAAGGGVDRVDFVFGVQRRSGVLPSIGIPNFSLRGSAVEPVMQV